ncbi:MAG: DUF2569 family protein [Sutterellaceae bacterium]|nr:DUF2569 domain-containing protein [Burkholderiaceae bacterium]MDW8429006.1 DUF2569 family protein [Sutterellaceae bacterium]
MVSEDYRFFLQRYRGMPTEQLLALRAGPLTDTALKALNEVLAEREVSPEDETAAAQLVADEARPKEPRGVGGWLAVLVAILTIGPLLSALVLGGDFTMAERQDPELLSAPQWRTYKRLTWCAFALLAAVSVFGGLGLLRRRDKQAVTRAKLVLWICGPLGAFVHTLAIPWLAFGTSVHDTPGVLGALTGSSVVAAIWTAYLSRSKRVRNTYLV